MARALRRACRDRGLPVTGHAALRTTPLALRRLGQGSPAACGECGGPQRRAPECLAARQTTSHHAALTPCPSDGHLTPYPTTSPTVSVRDPVALLGNTVPAGGIGLERHSGQPLL